MALSANLWDETLLSLKQSGNALVTQAIGTDLKTAAGLLSDPMKLVKSVTVESEWTPKMVVPNPMLGPAAPPAEKGSMGKAMLSILKPKLTVDFQGGLKSMKMAPYGEPKGSKWVYVQTALVVSGIIFGVVLIRGVRGCRCNRK